MSRAIITMCTADYYQYYIPIFLWSALRTFPGVDIIIYLRGRLDNNVNKGLKLVPGEYKIVENYKTNYPYLVGTTNALRFIQTVDGYDEVLITDIDFFFSKVSIDIYQFNQDNKTCNEYSGHHGPWHRPHRPEICPAWKGDFERITGGFFVAYEQWWSVTEHIRIWWDNWLRDGSWGNFRESDECMLSRMIKVAGLPIAKKIPYPRALRYLHFGDFKPNMIIRYENKEKMAGLLDRRHVNSFLRALSDVSFAKILSIVQRNPQMKEIITRTIKYCEGV